MQESEAYHKSVDVLAPPCVMAVGTQIIVCALWASEAMASLYFQTTDVASAGKGWSVWVVQMVQHHSTAVLSPPDGVKLIVIPLAQRQERLQALVTTTSCLQDSLRTKQLTNNQQGSDKSELGLNTNAWDSQTKEAACVMHYTSQVIAGMRTSARRDMVSPGMPIVLPDNNLGFIAKG